MDNIKKYHKLLDAVNLAWMVHEGQYRHDGITPYIFHPLTVMMNVDSYEAKIVAVLHDTIEDVELTKFSGLRQMILDKFGPEIYEAVEVLTRLQGQEYEKYIEQVCQNKLAREVKIADITHNLNTIDQSRTKKIKQYKDALKTIYSQSVMLS